MARNKNFDVTFVHHVNCVLDFVATLVKLYTIDESSSCPFKNLRTSEEHVCG